MFNRKNKAFTIVELVIVIAIIAILAAVLIPTFSSLIRSASMSSDAQLAKNMNTALAVAEATDGKNATFHDAVLDIQEAGFTVEKLTPTADDCHLAWDQVNDRIAFLDSDFSIVYADSVNTARIDNATFWMVAKNTDDLTAYADYNIYLAGTAFTGEITTEFKHGVDVGYNTGITALKYIGTGSAQNVIIRTNGGTLTIDAPLDTVTHYGEANDINVIAVADTSYVEYGEPNFIKFSSGRLVIHNDSKIGGILVSSNDAIIAIIGDAKLPDIIRKEGVTEFKVQIIDEETGEKQKEVIIDYSNDVVTVKDTTTQQAVVDLPLVEDIVLSTTEAVTDEESLQNKYLVTKVSNKAQFEAFLNSETKHCELTQDLFSIGSIQINRDIVIDGKNHSIIGDSSFVIGNNYEVEIKNIDFKNIHNNTEKGFEDQEKYDVTTTGTLSAIYANNFSGKLNVHDCTFDNVDWDCLQIVPIDGAVVKITNNEFRNTDNSYEPIRYVHIEGDPTTSKLPSYTAVVTDNKFYNGANPNRSFSNIGLYYYKADTSDLFLTGNYLEDNKNASIMATGNKYCNHLVYPSRSNADVNVDDYMPVAYCTYYDGSTKFYPEISFDSIENLNEYLNKSSYISNIEIHLMKDIELSSTLNLSKNSNKIYIAKLYLDGHDITGKNCTALNITGYFSIYGDENSKISTTSSTLPAITIDSTKTIYLLGLVVDGDLKCQTNVIINNASRLNGSVEIKGDLTVYDPSIFNGKVTIGGKIIANGGTFNKELVLNPESDSIIYGGTYFTKPDDSFLKTGYKFINEAGYYKVTELSQEEINNSDIILKYVTSTTTYYYKSFDEAFASSGTSFYLTQDVNISGGFTYTNDKTAYPTKTIYCDGHKLSGEFTFSGKYLTISINTDKEGSEVDVTINSNSTWLKELNIKGNSNANIRVSGTQTVYLNDANSIFNNVTTDSNLYIIKNLKVNGSVDCGGLLTATAGTFATDISIGNNLNGCVLTKANGVYTSRLMTEAEAVTAGYTAAWKSGTADASFTYYFKTLSEVYKDQITAYLICDTKENIISNVPSTTYLYCNGYKLQGSLTANSGSVIISSLYGDKIGSYQLDFIECSGSLTCYGHNEENPNSIKRVSCDKLTVSSTAANNYCTLTIDELKVVNGIIISKEGHLTIKAGTIGGKITEYNATTATNVSLTIEGGDFTGSIEKKIAGSIYVITGGAFSYDPSAYVDTNTHTVAKDGDYWFVSAK